MRTTILLAAILIAYKLNPATGFGLYWILIVIGFLVALLFDILNLNGDNVDDIIKARDFKRETSKKDVTELLKTK